MSRTFFEWFEKWTQRRKDVFQKKVRFILSELSEHRWARVRFYCTCVNNVFCVFSLKSHFFFLPNLEFFFSRGSLLRNTEEFFTLLLRVVQRKTIEPFTKRVYKNFLSFGMQIFTSLAILFSYQRTHTHV